MLSSDRTQTGSERGVPGSPDPPLAVGRGPSRGQGLVELALILPVLLLLVLAALDFGRVFLGWVVLNNAARVGANYASIHPDAWGTPASTAEILQYDQLVRGARSDAGIALADCADATVPAPTFPNGTRMGDFVQVDLRCRFTPITPVIGEIFASTGNQLTVSARSVFPIRTGVGSGGPPPPPTCPIASFEWTVPDSADWRSVRFSDTSVGGPASWLWDFGDGSSSTDQSPSHVYADDGTYTVVLTVDKGADCEDSQISRDVVIAEGSIGDPPPVEECSVPNFAGTPKSIAQTTWQDAGFTTQVQFRPPPREYEIQYQSLVGLQSEPCNVVIEIGPNPGGGGGRP